MISRITLSSIFLVFSIVGQAQELPKKATIDHIQVEGTNIFMIPPTSFSSSTNFKGFQDPTDPSSMIMIMEIPGPYSEVSKGFNANMLKIRGMELKTMNEIKIGSLDGVLIELDQPANGMVFTKHILAYGDEKKSTLINGVYLKDSLELGKRIKKSVLTTYTDSQLNVNKRESLNYSVDETKSGLKFNLVMGNAMLFNRDLKRPTESLDKASLLIDKSFAQVEIENKKLFCIQRIKKYPIDYSIIPDKGINEIEVNGLKGIELYASNNEDTTEEMYQLVLFDTNGTYYLFHGSYIAGSKSAIVDIKKLINTFNISQG